MGKLSSSNVSEKDYGSTNKGQLKGNGKFNYRGNKKQILKGANAWRDQEDDATKEIIAKDNFEKRKLYTINEKGDKVKQFKKQGVERPFLDLKYEENEKMTYYDFCFIKRSAVQSLDALRESFELQELDKITIRKKMMKAIRKEKRILDKEEIYAKKFELIKKGELKGPVKVWNKKNKTINTETSREENPALMFPSSYTEKSCQQETSILNSNTISKSAVKQCENPVDSIEGLDLNYEVGLISDDLQIEDAQMEFNGIPYSVIETNVDKLEEQSDSDMDTNAVNERDHSKETEHLLNDSKTDDGIKESSKLSINNKQIHKDNKNFKKLNTNIMFNNVKDKKSHIINSTSPKVSKNSAVYEENKAMTCVDGFWIKKNCVLEVDRLRATKCKEIIAARAEGSDDGPALTEEEEVKLKVAMKPELNSMSNKLNSFLLKLAKKKAAKEPKRLVPSEKQRELKMKMFLAKRTTTSLFGKNNFRNESDHHKYSNKNFHSEQDEKFYEVAYNIKKRGKFVEDSSLPGMVRFDGYWIKKEAAVRLKELKAKLKNDGLPADQIAQQMKLERRREESKESKTRGVTCFSCRKTGHLVADCPLRQNLQGFGACFKCGSLEHLSSSCTDMTARSFVFATCFICREKGHISRECPKNSNGLYPDGGGCTLCDSNQHLIKDCPRNVDERRKRPTLLTAGTMAPGGLLEVDEEPVPLKGLPSKKGKHIKF